MSEIWKWIVENRAWIFDGVGVVLITGIITLLIRRRKTDNAIKQTQVGGDNSTNVQSAGNITINAKGENTNGKRAKPNRRR